MKKVSYLEILLLSLLGVVFLTHCKGEYDSKAPYYERGEAKIEHKYVVFYPDGSSDTLTTQPTGIITLHSHRGTNYIRDEDNRSIIIETTAPLKILY